MRWPSLWRLLQNKTGIFLLTSFSKHKNTRIIARSFFLRQKPILTPRARKLVQYIFPERLEGEFGTKITAGIVTTFKDSQFLNLSITGIEKSLGENLYEIFIVCPKSDFIEMHKFTNPRVTILKDEDLINDNLLDVISRYPQSRRGWIKQQVLKMALVEYATTQTTLLVDADTILLRRQKWFDDDGNQALAISDEFHEPYQSHIERFQLRIGIKNLKQTRVSFVTHHQLMQKSLIKQLFETILNADFDSRIATWLNAIDQNEPSSACEWHTYGNFLLNVSRTINFYQWKNLAISPVKLKSLLTGNSNLDFEKIRKNYPEFNSISAHHYL